MISPSSSSVIIPSSSLVALALLGESSRDGLVGEDRLPFVAAEVEAGVDAVMFAAPDEDSDDASR